MILILVDLTILHLLETHMVLVTRFCIGCIGYVYVCHKGNCLTSQDNTYKLLLKLTMPGTPFRAGLNLTHVMPLTTGETAM